MAETANETLQGLGGWLVLVGFGLVVGLGYWPYRIFQTVSLFNDGTVQFMSDPSASVYIVGYSALLKFELISQMGLLAANICLLNLFFRKNQRFPRYYTGFLLILLIFAALDYVLFASALARSTQEVRERLDETVSSQMGQIGRSAVATLVWGLYMARSRRVKATFVN